MSGDDQPFRLGGDIRATTMESIAKALPTLPGVQTTVSDEIELDGDDFDLVISPASKVSPGVYEFLASGNAWMNETDVYSAMKLIAASFDEAGIVYRLEFKRRGAETPWQVLEHPQFFAGKADD